MGDARKDEVRFKLPDESQQLNGAYADARCAKLMNQNC